MPAQFLDRFGDSFSSLFRRPDPHDSMVFTVFRALTHFSLKVRKITKAGLQNVLKMVAGSSKWCPVGPTTEKDGKLAHSCISAVLVLPLPAPFPRVLRLRGVFLRSPGGARRFGGALWGDFRRLSVLFSVIWGACPRRGPQGGPKDPFGSMLPSFWVDFGPILAHFRVHSGAISERRPPTSVPRLSAHRIQIEA